MRLCRYFSHFFCLHFWLTFDPPTQFKAPCLNFCFLHWKCNFFYFLHWQCNYFLFFAYWQSNFSLFFALGMQIFFISSFGNSIHFYFLQWECKLFVIFPIGNAFFFIFAIDLMLIVEIDLKSIQNFKQKCQQKSDWNNYTIA